ncbi:unnamed protein product [Effrenium voratum]|uniref:Methyltransferase type 11 domain-containing protein n=1 Tax=Effrenium voratum TaxID=2562239 RepID=A0AA36N6K8_9DINO|nr:unnamed protein product [Effrenium voratum]
MDFAVGIEEFWPSWSCTLSIARTLEWLLTWRCIAPIFEKYCGQRKRWRILHAGCGNSALTDEMHEAGYECITSIDNSATAIEQMKAAHCEMEWHCMDATAMSFRDRHFDVVIEKGLVDCLLCMEAKDLESTKFLKEVVRVLALEGLFFCISFSQSRGWRFQDLELRVLEMQPLPAGRAGLNFLYVCQKHGEDILDRWPCVRRDLELGLSKEEYRLLDQPAAAWGAAAEAAPGDVVEVAEAFESGDAAATLLPAGLRGIVKFRDEDGDALIRFPRLEGVDSVDRFVLQGDIARLRLRTTM